MTLKLVGIGGMGLMLSPSANHLQNDAPAQFVRIYDRGTKDQRRDQCREQWIKHGANIVNDYGQFLGDGDFDGIVICAGKNGDDCKIIKQLAENFSDSFNNKFILHLSTVSSGFATSAHAFLSTKGIDYVNYPLTGGPLGAQNANMLILASGSEEMYQMLEPTLQVIGNPKYFSDSISAGAEVKLMGQLMVFNGLVGISSAAALKSACFNEDLSGESQSAFFDFLNGGAGGTRQWDVALSKGVRDTTWDQGFMIHHAVVDAIYAAKLCQERGLPAMAIIPMVSIALTFTYLLHKFKGAPLATHAIVREMIQSNAAGLDEFINHRIDYSNIDQSINNCIDALPGNVKDSVLLDITATSFE